MLLLTYLLFVRSLGNPVYQWHLIGNHIFRGGIRTCSAYGLRLARVWKRTAVLRSQSCLSMDFYHWLNLTIIHILFKYKQSSKFDLTAKTWLKFLSGLIIGRIAKVLIFFAKIIREPFLRNLKSIIGQRNTVRAINGWPKKAQDLFLIKE
jgi:hypothetical protein